MLLMETGVRGDAASSPLSPATGASLLPSGLPVRLGYAAPKAVWPRLWTSFGQAYR